MPETLIRQEETPHWVKDIFNEIDMLEFGPGFAHLTSKTEMQFGTAIVIGAEAIEQFFVKIDSPLEINHRVHDFWEGGAIKILRGDAVLRKKGSTDAFISTPFMHIFYMSEDDTTKVGRWFIVNGPIKTDSVI